MNFDIVAFTNRGTNRNINQDRILVNGNLLDDGKVNLFLQSKCICFVADGVGGNKRGEYAAQFVLESLKNEVSSDLGVLTERLKKINLQLIDTASKDISIQGTATTLTGLYIDSDNFYIFHAGDSELWLLRNNMFSKVTIDQVAEDLPNSPITSYFGGFEDTMTPAIGISLNDSEENDFYLICSDGLYKSLKFEEVKSILCDSNSISKKAQLLLDSAISKGAPDNISVILIHRRFENTKADNIRAKQLESGPLRQVTSAGIVSTDFVDFSTGAVSFNSTSEKTGVVSSINDSDKTGVVSGNHGNKVTSAASLHFLAIGDILKLKNKEYRIESIISEGTGEASVYLVTDSNDNKVALKLYKEFDNPKHEPNPEALSRIRDIHNPDILRLHDYGVGLDKYQGKYCYELSDYAEGGDLQNYSINSGLSIDFIEKGIIPEIFYGIKILHDNRIYHCDLKPGNIFFLDKQHKDIVIGDYGSAKTFDKDSQIDIQSTTTVKGTNVYMAPEQGRGHVSDKNDYYSLGMIILSMVYPDSLKSFREITVRQSKGVKIIDYNPKYSRINNLIEGCTLNSLEHRFGRIEVEKWMNGEIPKVRYAGHNNTIIPVKLGGGKLIETGEDFVSLLDNNEDWYSKYIENTSSWSQFLIWLNSYLDMQSRSTFEGLRKHYENRGIEYLKEAFIRFFEPTRPIRIDFSEFDFHRTSDVKKEVEKFCSKLDEIWKITDWRTIRFYLFQFEFTLRQLASKNHPIVALSDKLLTSFGILPRSFEDLKAEIHININDRKLEQFRRNLLELFYAFNPERGFRNKNNVEFKTIEDVGLYFVAEPELFSDENLKSEKEVFLMKKNIPDLARLQHKSFIFEIFKKKAQTEIEFISLSFDKYRNYVIYYKFFKSLNEFFKSKNISIDFTDRSESNLEFHSRRKLFKTFVKYADETIIDISNKHNIVTLNEDNKIQFKKKFIVSSSKRYAYIYSGQLLAFLILLLSIYLIYMLVNDKLSVD